MTTFYRVMLPDADGLPTVGRSARLLGVRVPPDPFADVRPDSDGLVHPGGGGMSVAPDSMDHLPRHRMPRSFGRGATGRDTDVVYAASEAAFAATLQVRPDPANPSEHAFVEPDVSLTLTHYEDAIAATRPH